MSTYKDKLAGISNAALLGEYIDQERMTTTYRRLMEESMSKKNTVAEQIKIRNLHASMSAEGAMYDVGLARPIWVRMSGGYLKVSIVDINDGKKS